MKDNYTQIAVVLDRSGSMGTIRKSTIDAYNEFINAQKQVPGTADVYLAQFDDQYEVLYDRDINNVPLLTTETFVPRGMTALHDAIGHTIDKLGNKLSNLSEDERPSKVIVAIFTDGGENASKDYKNKIAPMVKEQQEKYGWSFNYFGANQDAVAVGTQFNIDAGSTYTFNADPHSMHNTMGAANYVMAQTRQGIKLTKSQVSRVRGITGQSAAMSWQDINKQVDSAV